MIQLYTNLLPCLAEPSTIVCSQSQLATSLTINSDLQSNFKRGAHDLINFNISKTPLLTNFASNTQSNYPILFEDRDVLLFNSVSSLGLQISVPPACLG